MAVSINLSIKFDHARHTLRRVKAVLVEVEFAMVMYRMT